MASALELPATMFAWRKHRGSSTPVYEEVPVPQIPPNGILCQMLAAGVCRSDHSLLKIDKQASWFQEKYILGHEGCGKIIGIGSDVQEPKLKIGDVVALHAVPGCGEDDCPECSRDLVQICERGHHSGIGQDGFYAPYATLDIRGAVLVPEGVTPAEAAVATDAVSTAFHAITRRGQVQKNEVVFLFGLGGLGFNALQILLHIGPRIIVSDVKQERLDEAQKFGVPAGDIVPIGTSPQDFVRENNLNIDTVLDFVGSHQTFEDAQHIVRRGGKVICVGTLDADNTLHMKVGTRKRLSFIFSYGSQVQDLEEVLQLIASGSVKPQVDTKSLADFPHVLNELVEGKIPGRVALTQDWKAQMS